MKEDTVTIKMSLLKYYLECEKKLSRIRDIMEVDSFKDFYKDDDHFNNNVIPMYHLTSLPKYIKDYD